MYFAGDMGNWFANAEGDAAPAAAADGGGVQGFDPALPDRAPRPEQ